MSIRRYDTDPRKDVNTSSRSITNEVLSSTSPEVHSTDPLARLMRANGIFARHDYNDFERFYRFPRNNPYSMLGTTREYVFFTKPDLHILNPDNSTKLNDEIANDPYFNMLIQNGYGDTVLNNLQFSVDESKPFVPVLSNYKKSSLELNNISAEDIESGTNAFGTKMSYRNSSYRSDEYNDFSIEFSDTKYLDCYLWFKTYDVYERKKAEGRITPTKQEYTLNKIISDQITIFKFIVGEDGETLIHWSCFWGCYPKSVPRDTFSELPADGQLKFTINWHCSFQDDMDPLIIRHFNKLSDIMLSGTGAQIAPVYDEEIHAVSQESVLCPKIAYMDKSAYKNSPYSRYVMHWYTDQSY